MWIPISLTKQMINPPPIVATLPIVDKTLFCVRPSRSINSNVSGHEGQFAPKYKRPSSMECRERKSHAWCVCLQHGLHHAWEKHGRDNYIVINTGLKEVLVQYELFTDRNTRDHLTQTIGNGDSMHEVCIPHSISRAWEQ